MQPVVVEEHVNKSDGLREYKGKLVPFKVCGQDNIPKGLLCPSCGATLFTAAGFWCRAMATAIDWMFLPVISIMTVGLSSWEALAWPMPIYFVLSAVIWYLLMRRNRNGFQKHWHRLSPFQRVVFPALNPLS